MKVQRLIVETMKEEYKNFCYKTDKRCFSSRKFCLRKYLYTKLVEYNTNTSTHYPTNEGNDIVRTYKK